MVFVSVSVMCISVCTVRVSHCSLPKMVLEFNLMFLFFLDQFSLLELLCCFKAKNIKINKCNVLMFFEQNAFIFIHSVQSCSFCPYNVCFEA